jgi:hypothetical protein
VQSFLVDRISTLVQRVDDNKDWIVKLQVLERFKDKPIKKCTTSEKVTTGYMEIHDILIVTSPDLLSIEDYSICSQE